MGGDVGRGWGGLRKGWTQNALTLALTLTSALATRTAAWMQVPICRSRRAVSTEPDDLQVVSSKQREPGRYSAAAKHHAHAALYSATDTGGGHWATTSSQKGALGASRAERKAAIDAVLVSFAAPAKRA